MEKQKIVLKLELDDDKTKQKAMKNVCSYLGVESVSMDMKEKKMTVVGHVDITNMVKQLRKLCHTDLVLVGSVAEKEEEPKKMEPKKIEPKKMEPKKMEPKKPKEKKDSKDESYNNPGCAACTRHYYYYYCYHATCHVEEYPNACVIC